MKNYLSILKLLIKNMFSRKSKPEKQSSKGNLIAIIISVAVLYIIIVAGIISLIILFGPSVKSEDLINEFIVAILVVVSIVVLLFGIVSMLNYLYFSKDTEFFLSLPIKPSTIYLAKMTVVYLTELVLAAAILIPLLITLGAVVSAPALFYLISLLGIILAPSIPLLLASALAIPLMYVIGFFKHKGALASIVLILIFGLFFGVYFYFVLSMNGGESTEATDIGEILRNMKGFLVTLSNIFYPFLSLARMATLSLSFGLGKAASFFVNFTIFFGSVAGLILLSVLISNFVYKRGASSQLENSKKQSTGKEKFVSGSPLKALISKEWKELIRTPYFAYQCLSSVVIAPIFVAFMAFSTLGDMGGISNADVVVWFIGFTALLIMGVGLNTAASTAITREGSNFCISKSIPVSYKVQLQAKLILVTAISVICAIVSLIVLTVATQDFINLIFGLIFCFLYAYGFNCFAIYVDLRKPKLDWSTPNEAVKQNFNTILPFLINILATVVIVIVPFLLIFFLDSIVLMQVITWIILYTIAIIFCVFSHTNLFKNADRLYDKLSV